VWKSESWHATRCDRKPLNSASPRSTSLSRACVPTSQERCATRCGRNPTRFVHIFIWRDAEANRIHGESAAIKKFAGILYPNCLAPVEFIEYKQIDANATFRRVK